jgi:hypothetical protein
LYILQAFLVQASDKLAAAVAGARRSRQLHCRSGAAAG